jgi:hypothetical protein
MPVASRPPALQVKLMQFEPVILFFLLGLSAGLLRSDLKIPGVVYEALSIFLLLAIGLKGGVELARHDVLDLAVPALVVVSVAMLIPLACFPVLLRVGRLPRADAASIAAHYGSVSVVTFAVASSFLASRSVAADGYMTVFLALLELPALLVGVFLARRGQGQVSWGTLLHEVLAGKSIILLAGGLLIGWLAGPEGIRPLDRVFFDLFKGMLAFFLLEMGLVAAGRLADLRRAGPFLVAFAVVAPVCAGLLGIVTASLLGFSVGNAVLLATLYASASYIAAPAAMRIAVPEANPALSIGASLGITFPFNLISGIPLYHWLAFRLNGVLT